MKIPSRKTAISRLLIGCSAVIPVLPCHADVVEQSVGLVQFPAVPVIDFEQPAYTEGGFNTGGRNPADFTTGQGGWSNASGSAGRISANTANGLVDNGQFLTLPAPSAPGNNVTMLSGRKGGIEYTGSNTISFDLRAPNANDTQITVGYMKGFPDNAYANANAGMQFGVFRVGSAASYFGIRRSGFGTLQQIVTGPVTAGNWYRVEVTISGLFVINPGESGRTVTMSVFDYANNQTLASGSWNGSDAVSFGNLAPEDSAGIMARVQRANSNDNLAGALDNLRFTAALPANASSPGYNAAIWGSPAATPVADNSYIAVAGLGVNSAPPIGPPSSTTIAALDATNYQFAGDSLTLPAGTRLLLLTRPDNTATAPLVLDGGFIQLNNGSTAAGTSTLAGSIQINAASHIGVTHSTDATLDITAPISGTGTLNVVLHNTNNASPQRGVALKLTGNLGGFTGNINLAALTPANIGNYMTFEIPNPATLTSTFLAITNPAPGLEFTLEHNHIVRDLLVGDYIFAPGTYDSATLNLLSKTNVFFGTGSITISNTDTDGDGLSDWYETQISGTLPNVADTDGDGVKDGDELNGVHAGVRTNPLVRDTDGDGLEDFSETNTGVWVSLLNSGTNPTNPDSDGDGIPDGKENPNGPTGLVNGIFNSDPNLADTDSDGFSDATELLAGSNPNEANSTPSLVAPIHAEAEAALFDAEDWSLIDAVNQPYGSEPDPGITPSIDHTTFVPLLSGGAALVHDNDELGDAGAFPSNGAARGSLTFSFTGLQPETAYYLYTRLAVPTNSAIVKIDQDNGEPNTAASQEAGANDSFFAERTPGEFTATTGVNQLWERGPNDALKWFLVTNNATARAAAGQGVFVPIPTTMPDVFTSDAAGNLTLHLRGREVGLLLDAIALSPLPSLMVGANGGIGSLVPVDSDGDGLSDYDEVVIHQTHPNQADSDDDSFNDGDEIAAGTDPNDPLDFPTVVAGIQVTGVSRSGNTFIIRFASTAGLTGWRIKGSTDLLSFPVDETVTTVVTEIDPGQYEAAVDVTGDPPTYFLRVER
jgi:hypothetical protein